MLVLSNILDQLDLLWSILDLLVSVAIFCFCIFLGELTIDLLYWQRSATRLNTAFIRGHYILAIGFVLFRALSEGCSFVIYLLNGGMNLWAVFFPPLGIVLLTSVLTYGESRAKNIIAWSIIVAALFELLFATLVFFGLFPDISLPEKIITLLYALLFLIAMTYQKVTISN